MLKEHTARLSTPGCAKCHFLAFNDYYRFLGEVVSTWPCGSGVPMAECDLAEIRADHHVAWAEHVDAADGRPELHTT